jgi:DNA-3-methyladenine glycosylase II
MPSPIPATPPRRLDHQSLATGVAELCAREPGFRLQFERLGPPPLWARAPGYAALLRIILEQQVSLASAAALYRRIAARVGRITPQSILGLGEEGLRALGVTRQKAHYCVGLARALLEGEFDLAAVARADDEAARRILVARKGVGPWTAAIYQLMALRRPDIWPEGDLALLVALQRLHGLAERPGNETAAALTAHWSPWRSVGARMLWQAYLAR